MRKALFILAATVAAGTSVNADKIKFEQAPPAVQNAIRSQAGNAQIEDIDREIRNGQVTYEASFKTGNTQQELLVSEAGTILRDVVGAQTSVAAGLSGSPVTLSNRAKIALTATPPAVQKAFRDRIATLTLRGPHSIEDVDKGIWNGQTVYEAAYTQNGQRLVYQVNELGKPILAEAAPTGAPGAVAAAPGAQRGRGPVANSMNMQLRQAPQAVQDAVNKNREGAKVEYFSRGESNGRPVYQVGFRKDGQPMLTQILENGTIIGQGPGRWTSSSASVSTQPFPPSAQAGTPRYAGLSPANVPLTGGSKIGLESAPQPVQDTIRQMTAGARVEDLERAQWNGRIVYEAAFKRNGQHTELQILEDGSILTSAPAPGSSPTAAVGAGATGRQLRYAGLAPTNVQLSGGAKVPMESTPQPVRDAVNQFAAGAQIEDMERGTWNGRTVYEAAFKKNGQHIELQVLEDGSILTHAPAGSAVGGPAAGTITPGQQ